MLVMKWLLILLSCVPVLALEECKFNRNELGYLMEEITDQNNASAIDFPLTASNKCEIKAMNLIICI